jgi:hypothetical protein
MTCFPPLTATCHSRHTQLKSKVQKLKHLVQRDRHTLTGVRVHAPGGLHEGHERGGA